MTDDLNALSDDAFRLRFRTWLSDVFPEQWRDPFLRLRGQDAAWWQRTQFEAGWRAPAWPREHGGLGLSLAKQIIYQEELERHGTARTLDHGGRMVGPILIRFGTARQRETYLPRILTGEDQWCQGYSEPNAGSDLASLKMSAVRDGDCFRLNGQKIWTTLAGDSTHIYVLARTAKLERKQQGITLFLLDMSTPGLDIRPIRNLLGEEEFYEVFFDNVPVPAENVVGEVDHGWSIAKTLLGFERFSQGSPSLARYTITIALRAARDLDLLSDGRYADRMSRLLCDLHDSAALYRDICEAVVQGDEPGNQYSIAKLASAELFQRSAECLFDIAGEAARLGADKVAPGLRETAERLFYISRPVTIFGGTAEIQRNILAKSLI